MSTTDQNQINVTLKPTTTTTTATTILPKSVTIDVSNIIVPNQLHITLNTSIPGFQKITYKPSMSIKDNNNNDTNVLFNPLIKLNQGAVDKIPEQLRKKQFFNKGLFESLIRTINNNPILHITSPPAKNLRQATGYGYVDNNIKITLETIFSEKSVIYISGKPYVIADMQWTVGDRHIDIKGKKTEIDVNRITDPLLYQKLVKEQLLSGEEQLKTLDKSIIYGPNYNGPTVTTPTVTSDTSIVDDGTARGIKKQQKDVEPTDANKTSTSTELVPYSKPVSTEQDSKKEDSTALVPKPPKPLEPPKPQLVIGNVENPPTEELPKNPAVEELPEIPKKPISTISLYTPTPEEIIYNDITANEIKIFLNNQKFYKLINDIFRFGDERMRSAILETLKNYTDKVIRAKENISRGAYMQSVNEIQLAKNTGAGDCFFIAVAQGINNHNFNNQKNKIVKGNYGTTSLFTQMYLRSLVYDYLSDKKNKDILEISFITAESYMNDLNNKFKLALEESKNNNINIDEKTYIDIARNLYKTNENFLVQNITSIPIDVNDYDNPFKLVEISNLENYILSNDYWANNLAIDAICKKLRLNIITIEKYNNNLRIPFANLLKNDTCSNWNNFLFLYLENNHYELITFKYYTSVYDVSQKKNTPKQGQIFIFNNSIRLTDLPPIYILFIIYGSYYDSLTRDNKNLFNFKPEIMEQIYNVINDKIMEIPEISLKYYTLFKAYFPDSKIKEPPKNPQDEIINEPISKTPSRMRKSKISDESSDVINNEPISKTPSRMRKSKISEESSDVINNAKLTRRTTRNKSPDTIISDTTIPDQTDTTIPDQSDQNPTSGGENPRRNRNQYYDRYYNSYYRPPPYYAENIMRRPSDVDKSQLSYYITIDLELYPGTTIPPDKLANLKCNHKWNAVRKSYATLTGSKYVIPPIYYKTPINKTIKNTSSSSEKKPNEDSNKSTRVNNNKTMKKR